MAEGIQYIPSDYIDAELAGRQYSTSQLTLAPFLAGSLREIVLSVEFCQFPASSKRKIEHLSFLMHLNCRFDDFPLLLQLHSDILRDINSGIINWSDSEYFEKAEKEMFESLDRKHSSTDVKLDQDTKINNDFEDFAEITSYLGTYSDVTATIRDEFILTDRFVEEGEGEEVVREEVGMRDEEDDSMMIEDQEERRLYVAEDNKEVGVCEVCQAEVVLHSTASMSKHVREHHSTLFSCPFCSFARKSSKIVLKHVERDHRNEAPAAILCPSCGVVNLGFREHLSHLETHTTLSCPQCSKQFRDEGKYRRHRGSCQKSGAEQVCSYCGKFYKHLQNHIYSAHTDRGTEKCLLCDYSSAIPGGVSSHFKRVHNKPEVCGLCNKTVKDLKRHIRRGICSLTEEDRRTIPCTQCTKVFTQKYHLERHISNVHMRNKDFRCPKCTYKTSSNFNLSIHVKRVHEGKELKSDCPFCSKKVFNLDWHMKAYHQEELLSSAGIELDRGLSRADVQKLL